MKKKIIGIFICTMLITIVLPITGTVLAGDENDPEIDKENDWMDLPVEGNNIFLVDGKTIQLEPPCHLILYNLEGFGTSSSFIWFFIKSLIPPCLTYTFTFMGNCESYQIQNET